MHMPQREECTQALEKWGPMSQSLVAVEELNELIHAILKCFYRNTATYRDVASEICDVMILCQQMTMIVGEDLVDELMIEKVAKFKKYLEA